MNISKQEQRVLHELARGAVIRHERDQSGKIRAVTCYTRDGFVLEDCTLAVFNRLRKRRLVQSRNGQPYRASRLGILTVRAQMNQR